LGATLLRSDAVRLDISGGRPSEHLQDAYGGGIHDQQTTTATYAEMLHRAGLLLQCGESVILDASWTDRRWRQSARHLARTAFSDVCELRCDVPPEVAAQRIRRRLDRGDDVSAATPEVAARMAVDAHPWPSAATIDTRLDRAHTLTRALHAVAHARQRSCV
jgi:predicted kinase